jgi:hypothetical protein
LDCRSQLSPLFSEAMTDWVTFVPPPRFLTGATRCSTRPPEARDNLLPHHSRRGGILDPAYDAAWRNPELGHGRYLAIRAAHAHHRAVYAF